ncbi:MULTISPECIES: YwmB family TATA-box binding protein [Allobacillus]|uniref:YwmB family TATA-box binding protein n=1 Tax=Allobacillus halotolerans TaxID=570278 RepID=A0ABS6GS01_9BACI|nr:MULTISPECIES: YwmB family TATA-box binding protein [Allobacillus]MBU6081853.1 YwmB family TATA-box binding protein [Allobacillus halotolerans]
MRILFIGLYLISFIFTNHTIYQTTNLDDFMEDIETFDQYFRENELDIDSFSFTIRTELNESQVERLENTLIKKDSLKDSQKNDSLHEEFDVTRFDQRGKIQVTYVLSGDIWNEQVKNEIKGKLNDETFKEFFENGLYYSCYQSKHSDRMNSNLFFDRIREDFDIQEKNMLDESGFKVLGGKTDLIKTSLNESQHSINIQLAIREEVDGATLTIGTPILVIEY